MRCVSGSQVFLDLKSPGQTLNKDLVMRKFPGTVPPGKGRLAVGTEQPVSIFGGTHAHMLLS
jgi:hypothetical protein